MSEVKEWYKNAWYTPTMEKLKEEVEKLDQKIDEAMELPETPTENGSYNLVEPIVAQPSAVVTFTVKLTFGTVAS